MSITPALILLCRINITKFPQAQYFDDKQKLFVRSSVNLNCYISKLNFTIKSFRIYTKLGVLNILYWYILAVRQKTNFLFTIALRWSLNGFWLRLPIKTWRIPRKQSKNLIKNKPSSKSLILTNKHQPFCQSYGENFDTSPENFV